MTERLRELETLYWGNPAEEDESARIYCRETALRRRKFDRTKRILTESLVRELDRQVTGGKLSRLTGGIKVVWKERMPNSFGYTIFDSSTICLSDELVADEQQLRNTVCHEFTHVLAYQNHGCTDHGEAWLYWAQVCTNHMRPIDMGPIRVNAYIQESFEFIWQCEKTMWP